MTRRASMIWSDTHPRPSSASRLAWLVGVALFGLAGCNTFSEVEAPPSVDQVKPTVTIENSGDIK